MSWQTQAGTGLQANSGNVFIPEIWTAQLLQDLEENLVLGSAQVTNRQYEGEFRKEGDVVRVPHFVDTVNDKGLVKAYAEIGTPDHAALEWIEMRVAKGSSFHLEVDSLHQLQTKEGIDLMAGLVEQRARKLAVTVDELIAKTVLAAVSGKDLNGVEDRDTAHGSLPDLHGQIDEVVDGDFPANETIGVYDFIVKMLENLDIKSAPQDRYLFISPRMRSLLLRDPHFIDASHWGGNAVMPTGAIGSILGVPVQVANTLGSHTRPTNKLIRKGNQAFQAVDLLMGSTAAVSLVIPFAEMAAYQPEKKFTDAIKSRVIYDAKVIRPEQLVVARDVENVIATHNAAVGGGEG